MLTLRGDTMQWSVGDGTLFAEIATNVSLCSLHAKLKATLQTAFLPSCSLRPPPGVPLQYCQSAAPPPKGMMFAWQARLLRRTCSLRRIWPSSLMVARRVIGLRIAVATSLHAWQGVVGCRHTPLPSQPP